MAKQTTLIEPLATESKADFIKFRVFLALGVNRNLEKAFKAYYETTHEPSQLWRTLADKNHWVDRASEHDKASAPHSK
jgi:hypothetical protein